MIRECPQCGTVNPPTAEQCDCGYEFATGRVTASPVPRLPASPVAWLLVPVGLLLGAVFGGPVTVLVEGPTPGLTVILQLLKGAVLGAVLGGVAGTVTAVLTRRRQRMG